jgi:hypothetical protein
MSSVAATGFVLPPKVTLHQGGYAHKKYLQIGIQNPLRDPLNAGYNYLVSNGGNLESLKIFRCE